MSCILNNFALRPPRNFSEAARNCQRNMKSLWHFPALQIAVSSIMSASMTLLTATIFSGESLINKQESPSNDPSSAILGIKITTLTVMTIANSAILVKTVISRFGKNSIAALSPRTPYRNRRLHLLTCFRLEGCSIGLISIMSFVLNNLIPQDSNTSLPILSMVLGSLSSMTYTTETIVALLISSGRTISPRRLETRRIRLQTMDTVYEEEENSITYTIDVDLGNDDAGKWPPQTTFNPNSSSSKLLKFNNLST
ncbi:hypothetical protein CLAVI_000529 [Candidatus Clavichlamydia salmonicola]|uniref:hypothetical protein n=1 Tax=Candidatus Clavichlamydia salmonicola TaxID=469812 RepID=UPI001890BD62|nr:hypothetical protein [Candidatus Clavichlamydia salmonicola]MBF5050907.1 hypothetical protein [Candidatus Clavichlamydia salmonicola]